MINNVNTVQQDKQDKEKQGSLARLPQLGSTSRMALLLGIFLVILIPLLLINQQQPAKQSALQQQIDQLQKILSSPLGKMDTVATELKQTDADFQRLAAQMPRADQSPAILARLVELATTSGITVIKTEIRSGQLKLIPDSKEKTLYPSFSLTLGLRGQVSKFQNFILALEKFPSSRISELSFTPALKAGDEDQASIKIDMFVYQDQQ